MDEQNGSLFSYVSLEERIPARYPLCKVLVIVNDALQTLDAELAQLYADNESFDLPIAVGQSARLELKRLGAIPYFCRVHSNMAGTVRVR